MLGSEAEALDTVHELFTGFLEKQPKSYELPYLYAAVTRRCLNRLRDGKNRRRLLDENSNGTPTGLGVPLEGRAVGRDLLFRLLERLHPKEAEVLTLCFMDGLAQDEAAEALRVSRRTVVNRLARVRSVAQELFREAEYA